VEIKQKCIISCEEQISGLWIAGVNDMPDVTKSGNTREEAIESVVVDVFRVLSQNIEHRVDRSLQLLLRSRSPRNKKFKIVIEIEKN